MTISKMKIRNGHQQGKREKQKRSQTAQYTSKTSRTFQPGHCMNKLKYYQHETKLLVRISERVAEENSFSFHISLDDWLLLSCCFLARLQRARLDLKLDG